MIDEVTQPGEERTEEAASLARPESEPTEPAADLPAEPLVDAKAEPTEADLVEPTKLNADTETASAELTEAAAEPAEPAEADLVEPTKPSADTEAASAELTEPTAKAEPAEPAAEAGAPPAPAESADGPQWYVIHCYSGYENKVRHNLEQRIASMGMKGKIFDVIVPTEEEIEVKEGKRRTVERRVFPGYLLVQMIMNEESWYVVRNTPGVTGFVGMGNTPTPLRPEEVAQILRRMEAEAPKVKVTFKPGQKVRIVDGPFNDFIGTVSEIDMDRTKVRVMVSFFGRETPVELDFLQVEKV
jgi:transcriptional antiterminator NusG